MELYPNAELDVEQLLLWQENITLTRVYDA